MKYPKIETLYNRNLETFKVTTGLRLPEFGVIHHWLVTEKIDGTNVRVILDPLQLGYNEVEIRGRTDNAQFNPRVLKTLQDMFPAERVRAAFVACSNGEWPIVILYGEAYGEKIQKGGKYRKGQSFRLFDVRVGDWWLNWSDVCDVARKLGISTVPTFPLLAKPLPTTKEHLAEIIPGSVVAYLELGIGGVQAEGVVARTNPLLFTRRGDRVMWKLKFKDFP